MNTQENKQMSTFKLLSTTAIAILISTSAWATEDGNKQDPSTMPMMPEGSGMMMNPQMMQMRMQHMAKMEQHLENIESLLSQLVELQKAK
jgi:hypothetical protein